MAVFVTLKKPSPLGGEFPEATKWIESPTGSLVIMAGSKASHIYAAGEWVSAQVTA